MLIHLLPGLALFAHRYAPVPEVVGHTWRRMFGGAGKTDLTAQKPPGIFWIFGAPLIFYVVWQLVYFLIVQVMLLLSKRLVRGRPPAQVFPMPCPEQHEEKLILRLPRTQVMCRSFIKRGGYDTSYNALAR